MKTYKAFVLATDQQAHIKPVEAYLIGKVDLVYHELGEIPENPEEYDIYIGINEHRYEFLKFTEAFKKANVPTLCIQDGVLEWRFMFDNPIYAGNKTGSPMHHPLLADKYACMGPLMAHHIANLGNKAKVEVTGMPKLDIIDDHKCITPDKDKKLKKVLVMTASKPWFDDKQKRILIEGLKEIKNFFESRIDIEPIWRITKGLDRLIGVETRYGKKDTSELKDQLDECDAVLTTVNTTIVESMLAGKPVCSFDFFNTPEMTPTVWKFTHISQMERAINSALNPSGAELWMQENYKHLLIRRDKSGAESVGELILHMIRFNKENPTKAFPENMAGFDWLSGETEKPELNAIYSEREVFAVDDPDWMRAKIVRLERENSLLNEQLSKRSLKAAAVKFYHKLTKILKA